VEITQPEVNANILHMKRNYILEKRVDKQEATARPKSL
jgi:hypothetical protein